MPKYSIDFIDYQRQLLLLLRVSFGRFPTFRPQRVGDGSSGAGFTLYLFIALKSDKKDVAAIPNAGVGGFLKIRGIGIISNLKEYRKYLRNNVFRISFECVERSFFHMAC